MKSRNGGATGNFSNYDFDFGLGSSLPRGGSSLNDQRNKISSSSSSAASWSSPSLPKSQPPQPQSKQQWVHKPAPGMASTIQESKPMAMVGDITGKSWVPATSTSTSGIVGGVGASKADMFSDLLGFNKQPQQSISTASSSAPIRSFGVPLNAMKDSRSHGSQAKASWSEADQFGDFVSSNSTPKVDPFEAAFGKNAAKPQAPSPAISKDPLEDLWKKIPAPAKPAPSSSASAATASKPSDDWMNGTDDWNVDGHNQEQQGNSTTELEGLPPPPPGLTASSAMEKGSGFQKQGQFADAIKWLTWAVSLAGTSSSMLVTVLSCRILCFKEVGEYKKAVEDCCQVLEIESSNTEVLLQRAFLYESMEKYKLGVEDLREVLKRDPSNRLASNTLARLVKMVD